MTSLQLPWAYGLTSSQLVAGAAARREQARRRSPHSTGFDLVRLCSDIRLVGASKRHLQRKASRGSDRRHPKARLGPRDHQARVPRRRPSGPHLGVRYFLLETRTQATTQHCRPASVHQAHDVRDGVRLPCRGADRRAGDEPGPRGGPAGTRPARVADRQRGQGKEVRILSAGSDCRILREANSGAIRACQAPATTFTLHARRPLHRAVRRSGQVQRLRVSSLLRVSYGFCSLAKRLATHGSLPLAPTRRYQPPTPLAKSSKKRLRSQPASSVPATAASQLGPQTSTPLPAQDNGADRTGAVAAGSVPAPSPSAQAGTDALGSRMDTAPAEKRRKPTRRKMRRKKPELAAGEGMHAAPAPSNAGEAASAMDISI